MSPEALAARNGTRALLIRDSFSGSDAWTDVIRASLKEAGVTILEEVAGPGPNAPRQDVQRITARIAAADPDVSRARPAGRPRHRGDDERERGNAPGLRQGGSE